MRQFSKNCNGWQKVGYTLVAKSYTAPLEKDFKIDANGAHAFMGHFLCAVDWFSQNRNLRDRDQLLVKTSRPRLYQKSRDLRLEFRDRDSKLCAFCRIFLNDFIASAKLIFFQISGIFSTCFGCFLPANTANKKSLNYRNFTLPVFGNIQGLETCILWNRDETWNLLVDRDSQKWVLRRSLVVQTVKCFVKVHMHCNVSNLINISKMSTLPPSWKNFCGHPWLLSPVQQALTYRQVRRS